MPSRRKPVDPSFPLSAVVAALKVARVTEEQKERVLKQLDASRPKRGRKPENDDADVGQVLILWLIARDEGKKISVNAVAAQVAAQYPEHQRNAAKKRLARKTRQVLKESRPPDIAGRKLL